MPFALLRISAFASAILLLSGCGSSSGGSNDGAGSGGGNTPTAVSITFSGATPAAVATQIGTSSFSAATVSSNTVTVSLPSGTQNFAVAWVCPAIQGSLVETYQYVLESTTTDGTSYDVSCPESPQSGQTGTLSVSIDATMFPTGDSLAVGVQNGSSFVLDDPGPQNLSDYSISAPVGSDQVDIFLTAENNPYVEPTVYMVAAKSFTGVTVPGTLNGGSTVKFISADQAVQEPITYKSIPQGFGSPATGVWVLPSGEQTPYISNQLATTAYQALPATIAKSGDQYLFLSESYCYCGTTQGVEGQFVGVNENITGAGPAMLTFPASWNYGGPTPAALPKMDITYSGFSGQKGSALSGLINWVPVGSINQYFYQVTASTNFLGGSTTVQFPELSAVTGFVPDPVSGTNLHWTDQASQSDSGILVTPSLIESGTLMNELPANATQYVSGAFGGFTVP